MGKQFLSPIQFFLRKTHHHLDLLIIPLHTDTACMGKSGKGGHRATGKIRYVKIDLLCRIMKRRAVKDGLHQCGLSRAGRTADQQMAIFHKIKTDRELSLVLRIICQANGNLQLPFIPGKLQIVQVKDTRKGRKPDLAERLYVVFLCQLCRVLHHGIQLGEFFHIVPFFLLFLLYRFRLACQSDDHRFRLAVITKWNFRCIRRS